MDVLNGRELTEQWTAVHGTDDDPESLETVKGHEHRVYEDAAGRAVVESYLLANMAHAVPVDPGPRPDQCGSTSQHTAAVGICSSYQAARFWGLISESEAP